MSPQPTAEHDVLIIGAGPAGLTAAYELNRRGVTSTVLEATDMVGGISQTVERDGWRFDIGGHRFFTKVPEVEAFWHEILPDEDFLQRPRMSRLGLTALRNALHTVRFLIRWAAKSAEISDAGRPQSFSLYDLKRWPYRRRPKRAEIHPSR